MAPQELPQPWIETPLLQSAALSKAAGCRIFLKLENLQPSGSFKSRGIGNLVRSAILTNPSPHLHFYSSSGGNAGLACVTAAHTLGYPATVVVPLSTKPLMITKIRVAGATEVIQIGANWAEADRHLREEILANDANGVYVPPFDDPRIWEGASTMVEEMEQQLGGERPDAVVCSVGGGGLLRGVGWGLDSLAAKSDPRWKDIAVLAVETEGADSLSQSLIQEKHITLPKITSIATSLGAPRVAEEAYAYAQRPNVKSVVLSDAEAAMACWRFADDERQIVEAACGASIALCYDGRLKKLLPELTKESSVVVVVCGGVNVTLDVLAGYRETYGWVEKVATDDKDVPSTVSAPR
ncbi:catabolic L-serine/threonine dehydratase [Trapelia coarctata]|nr:catabolic L-serine/threonine dehydratase [Trapelia coarctata]